MNHDKNKKIIIYCDGACSGNQFEKNIGGWGVVLKFREQTKEIFGGEKNTSNQRMEITACIKALQAITKEGYPIEIYSDSAYLVNCMNERWFDIWLINGWKNTKKKPVENKDLWMKLLNLLKKHQITFHKVEGHTGDKLNERADKLAQLGISSQTK